MPPASSAAAIPLLNLSRFEASEPERRAFLQELRVAARDTGFFYLTDHGVAPALLRELMAVTQRFFALPEEQKLAIEMVHSPHFRGYNRVAWELTRGAPDWREQIDIGPERPALPRTPTAPTWTRLQGPNQWPSALPELRPLITRWQTAALEVLSRLLRAFSLALGQPENALESLHQEAPHHTTKLIRYPSRDTTQSPQGVGPHKDSELLTLLLQDNQPGLQVETPSGWVDVIPIPGTFVVNIGELLELASDGYLRATLHRVVTPPPGVERISLAFFLGARLDATVPLLRLPPELAAHAHGPESDPNNPLFRNVGQNYLKGRLRSHPDVARRHHADLLEPTNPSKP